MSARSVIDMDGTKVVGEELESLPSALQMHAGDVASFETFLALRPTGTPIQCNHRVD